MSASYPVSQSRSTVRARSLRGWLVVVAFLVACGDKQDSSGGTTDVENSDSSAIGTSGASGSTDSTSSAATDGAEPSPQAICSAFCGVIEECGLEQDFGGCPCDLVGGFFAECNAAWASVAECFVSESCQSLVAGSSQCWGLYNSAVELCGDLQASCSQSATPEASTLCFYVLECPGQPVRRVDCDAVSCNCTVNGVLTSMCPSNMACSEVPGAFYRFGECCELD